MDSELLDRRLAAAKPGIVWLSGPVAAGKTTVAWTLAQLVQLHDFYPQVVDADDLRTQFWPELGMSARDRRKSVARVGQMAGFLYKLLADLNARPLVVVACIAPKQGMREEAASIIDIVAKVTPKFVYLHASLEDRMERDQTGLYAKARSGSIKGVTGFDAPYEVPEDALAVSTASSRSAYEVACDIAVKL